jgi:hypothetical protein
VGTKNGTGLLDLPRELRDIIYGYVCHDMVHDGCGWRKEGEWADDTYSDDSDMDDSDMDDSDMDDSDMDDSDTDDQEPIVFQNCNIMRICRQVHWEFAEVLYARPLQLTGIPQSNKSHIVITGSHILPLSRTYAHLVKKLAFIHNIDREDYLGLEPRIGGHFHAEVLWLDVVTATRELLKLFPTLQILRILVTNDRPPEEDVLMALLGKRTDRREELVEIAEDLIQAVRWSDTKPIEVPQQLELLYLEINGIVREMPLSEALRNTQAAELHKKELREKS